MTGKEKCAIIMRANCKTVSKVITDINDEALIKVRNLGVKNVAKIRRLILE